MTQDIKWIVSFFRGELTKQTSVFCPTKSGFNLADEQQLFHVLAYIP